MGVILGVLEVYILIQWIALKVHSDWLMKLRISFAITTLAGFMLKNIVIIAGMNEFKSFFLCFIISLF